jgi:hypothetical protein
LRRKFSEKNFQERTTKELRTTNSVSYYEKNSQDSIAAISSNRAKNTGIGIARTGIFNFDGQLR